MRLWILLNSSPPAPFSLSHLVKLFTPSHPWRPIPTQGHRAEKVCGVLGPGSPRSTSGNILEGQNYSSPSLLWGCELLQAWDAGLSLLNKKTFIEYLFLHEKFFQYPRNRKQKRPCECHLSLMNGLMELTVFFLSLSVSVSLFFS